MSSTPMPRLHFSISSEDCNQKKPEQGANDQSGRLRNRQLAHNYPWCPTCQETFDHLAELKEESLRKSIMTCPQYGASTVGGRKTSACGFDLIRWPNAAMGVRLGE